MRMMLERPAKSGSRFSHKTARQVKESIASGDPGLSPDAIGRSNHILLWPF